MATACELALVLVVAAGTAFAQYPGCQSPAQYQPGAVGGQYQYSGGAAPTGSSPIPTFGQYPPGMAPPQLPGRPVVQPYPVRLPSQPPQTIVPLQRPAVGGSASLVAGGKVMYFTKPAGSLVPISGSPGSGNGSTGSSQATEVRPAIPTIGAPDVATPSAAAEIWMAAGQVPRNQLLPYPPPPLIQPQPSPAGPSSPPVIPQPTPPPSAPQPALQPPNQPTEPMQPQPLQPRMEDPKPLPFDPQAATVLPPREQIFQMRNDVEMERAILDRLRREQREQSGVYDPSLRFPPTANIGGGLTYEPKTIAYAPRSVQYNALYVVHRRLLFEEKNAERQGWDFGIVQPLLSATYFYRDVAMLPHNVVSGFKSGFWDTNAGKCLPGSQTPYYWYPPGLTISGLAVEGAFWTGVGFFIFP